MTISPKVFGSPALFVRFVPVAILSCLGSIFAVDAPACEKTAQSAVSGKPRFAEIVLANRLKPLPSLPQQPDKSEPDKNESINKNGKEKDSKTTTDTAKEKEPDLGGLSLDELFEKLGREPDQKQAFRLSDRIWRYWNESGSDSINLIMARAGKAMKQDKNALALDLLDQAIALKPDYAEAWNRRATVFFSMRNYERSLADIEQTLMLEPRHYGALNGLAGILVYLDREDDALKTLYRILEIYPANKKIAEKIITLEEKLAGEDA